ncbi:ABC transporter permease [Nocardia sp. NPDC051321]|uniref:ABC transporter permease n=1 Tax=Nocardia sp. NPDC051321 TaxID=3364323 RepID=UPI0037B4BC78
MTTYEQGMLIAGRNLVRVVRSPEVLASTLAVPLVLYIIFLVAFAKTILPGQGYSDYANFALPGLAAFVISFALPRSGSAIQRDLRDGILDRLRALPIGRSAVLFGRVGADATAIGIQIVLLSVVGFLFGARFHGGLPGLVIYLLAPVGMGAVLCLFTIPLALRAKSPEEVGGTLQLILLPLGFLSGGIVPIDALPGWLEPIARVNPLTCMVTAMRAAQEGDSTVGSVVPALLWIVLGGAFATALAARTYSRLDI